MIKVLIKREVYDALSRIDATQGSHWWCENFRSCKTTADGGRNKMVRPCKLGVLNYGQMSVIIDTCESEASCGIPWIGSFRPGFTSLFSGRSKTVGRA
jgi:hypothetical protein